MKKILLLFVLVLGLGLTTYAASEVQPVIEIIPIDASTPEKSESPTWIYIRFLDGTRMMINDGNDCIDFYDETPGGGTAYDKTIC